MTKQWYFINSGPCDPAYNMALDEALLHWHAEEKLPPMIRFYEWNPATLSVGYFQKAKRDIDFEQLEKLNLGFVRRPTGGVPFYMNMSLHIVSSYLKTIQTCQRR